MNKNLQKSLALGMAVAVVAPMATVVNAESKCEIVTTTGNNRYDTAAKLAKNAKNKDVAILVNVDKSLADGLSASGLAGVLDAPILLTKKDKIPKETMDIIKNTRTVYIIGGTNAISEKVEKEIELTKDYMNIYRIYGDDRVSTSKEVAKIVEAFSKKTPEKYLVNGFKGEADAMSIAPVAAKKQGAIILSDNKNYDKNYKPDYIIGSTGVISSDIENKSGATRIGGKDRYETNKLVINKFYKDADNFNVTKGNMLVDALTASAVKQPIVLASEKSDKSVLEGAKKVNLIGGLSDSIVNQITKIVNGDSNVEDKSSLIVGNDIAGIMRCEKFPFEQYNIKATDIDGTDITDKVKWIGTGGPDENPLHEIDTREAGGFPIEFYVTLKDGRVLHEPGYLSVETDYYSEYPLLTADYQEITVPVGYKLTLKDFGLFCWDTGYGNITSDITISPESHLPSTEQPGTYKFKVECINKDFHGSTLELTVHVK